MTPSLLQTHLRKRTRYASRPRDVTQRTKSQPFVLGQQRQQRSRLLKMSRQSRSCREEGGGGRGLSTEQRNRHNVGNSSSGKRFHMCVRGSRLERLCGGVPIPRLRSESFIFTLNPSTFFSPNSLIPFVLWQISNSAIRPFLKIISTD